MRKTLAILLLIGFTVPCMPESTGKEKWPDGSPISDWFQDYDNVDINKLGKQYRITDYGAVEDSTVLQTKIIQDLIDRAGQEGGGVIIIPKGTFLISSIFFKPGTHLHLEKGAVLKGSDDITDFPLIDTRMEGHTLKYFGALVNANEVDGFTISGEGTINGNGFRYWKSFWLRREWNPGCTNLDEMRPRLVHISKSKDIKISGITLKNSPFWNLHLYKCESVKLLGLTFLAPRNPVRAPSADGVDIDVCNNILIKNCYMSVTDDPVSLKGGKGPHADQDPDNGGNFHIIVEDCTFESCPGVLTCGSESVHDRNIIVRRNKLINTQRLLWLKMRPDTPQKYEYITVENIEGDVNYLLYIQPWTQFFDLKGEPGNIKSYANHITLCDLKLKCNVLFKVKGSPDYELSDFTFENFDIEANMPEIDRSLIKNFELKNVQVNGVKL
jgi:hypothetical protein